MEKNKIYQIIENSEFASSLGEKTMETLANSMTLCNYKQSANLYKKGTMVSKFIFIYSGSCSMVNENNETIRNLKPGDFFGLISLFTKSTKNFSLIVDESTTTLELKKTDLDRLTAKYSFFKHDLLELVNKKLFNPEINNALKTIAKGVDNQTIEEIKKDISWRTLEDNEILFKEGDVGDSCYVIMSGRVEAIKNLNTSNELVLGELQRGDIIGDMALITSESRSASIKATKLTRLIHISKKSFDSVMYNNPKALMEVSKQLINRIKFKEQSDKTQRNMIVGIISLLDKNQTDSFIDSLDSSLNQFGKIEKLNEDNSNINYEDNNINFEILLENMIAENDFVLLHPNNIDDINWNTKIMQFSDHVIVLGNSSKLERIGKKERKLFNDYKTINKSKYWLVLNHHENIITPQNTRKISKLRNYIKILHIKENNPSDIRRIARFLTKQTIGLTLGGGGAKGFAHLGVYKAMKELEIPIDVIGGTSAGSIVASQIALGNTIEEIIERNKKVNSLNMFKEYGFPYISLIKSKKIEEAAKLSAQNRDIEDLWIPFFAPATDLTNSKLVLFEDGKLWEAIRSSGALPGIVLPHFKDNNIIVDGGLMNNLPVDVMRNKFGGNIICSSCSSDQSMKTSINGVPNQSRLLLKKIFNKSNFDSEFGYVPTLTDIIFKTSVVASASQLEKNIQMSDLFLELPTSEFGITEFNNKSMLKMIDIGYEYSKPLLVKFKESIII